MTNDLRLLLRFSSLAIGALIILPYGAVASIGSWIDACERELDCLHGFVLLQHGKVVAEGTWKPFDTLNAPHMLYSHSKSLTSTAVGLLVDDGKIDLDERVVDLFSDKAPKDLAENLRQLRVRDLLTMNVGADHTDAENDDIGGDWERAFLANRFEGQPGTKFAYDSGATYMLSAIVERKSGMRMADFLKARLFDRIGISHAWTTTSPSGTACGGWGWNMTTRDLAKFGQLFLDCGLWRNERVLSAEWVALATARQTWSGAIGVTGEEGSDWHQGYGFQFWRCRHGFYRADGANGQLTVVMPRLDAVLSIHAGLDDMQRELDLVWHHLLPALEVEERTGPALRARLLDLHVPAISGVETGSEPYCGKVFSFRGTRQHIRSIRLEKAERGWRGSLVTESGTNMIDVGFGEWKTGVVRFANLRYEPLGILVGNQQVAASAAVNDGGMLTLRIFLVNAPQKIDLSFSCLNGMVDVKGKLSGIGECDLHLDEESRRGAGEEAKCTN